MSLQPVAKTPEEQLDHLLIQEQKLVRKINAAQRAGKKEKARKARQHYLRCAASKARAAYEISRKDKLKWSPETILHKANTISLWHQPTAAPRFRPKRKQNGGTRPVQAFAKDDKIRQRVIANLLNQCNQFVDYAYDIRGRGMHKLIADLKLRIEDGYKFVLYLDISSYFDNVNTNNAHSALHLPKTVVENVLTNSIAGFSSPHGSTSVSRRLHRTNNRSNSINGAQDRTSKRTRGIPQGSAASPVAATLLLGDLRHHLPKGVVLLAYRDDIIVLARQRAEACTALKSLEEALKDHPAGPLELGKINIRQISHGITLLGRHFKTLRGQLTVRAAGKGARNFQSKMFDRVLQDIQEGKCEPFHSLQYVNGWAAHYKDCNGIEQFRDLHLQRCQTSHVIALNCVKKNMTPARIKWTLKGYWRKWDTPRYD